VTLHISAPGGPWLQGKGRGVPARSSKSSERCNVMWFAVVGASLTEVASLMLKSSGKKSLNIFRGPDHEQNWRILSTAI
jgi:hypothetical protein